MGEYADNLVRSLGDDPRVHVIFAEGHCLKTVADVLGRVPTFALSVRLHDITRLCGALLYPSGITAVTEDVMLGGILSDLSSGSYLSLPDLVTFGRYIETLTQCWRPWVTVELVKLPASRFTQPVYRIQFTRVS